MLRLSTACGVSRKAGTGFVNPSEEKVTVTLAAALGLCAFGAEELKFAKYMSIWHPLVGSTFQPFADEVAAKTCGAVAAKLHTGGELGAGPVEQSKQVILLTPEERC